MPFIKAKDGAELYWREWGKGPPILFLSSLSLRQPNVGLPDRRLRR